MLPLRLLWKAYQQSFSRRRNFQGLIVAVDYAHRGAEYSFACRYHIGESMLPSLTSFLQFIGMEEKLRQHGFCVKVEYTRISIFSETEVRGTARSSG
jgi:hypothetical protein